MLSLPAEVRIYLCILPTDMRRGFDGLLAQAQQHVEQNPLKGGLYVFVNRRRDRVKLLWWDGDGLAIWYKSQEADYPHSFTFTEIGRRRHNLGGRPAAAG
jgi:transposase